MEVRPLDQSKDRSQRAEDDRHIRPITKRAPGPRVPVTARELAELVATTIEGGFMMANAKNDAGWTQRQSDQFQKYLKLLFAE